MDVGAAGWQETASGKIPLNLFEHNTPGFIFTILIEIIAEQMLMRCYSCLMSTLMGIFF